jgi:D-inositol-3-phosphate glycosyltransferase
MRRLDGQRGGDASRRDWDLHGVAMIEPVGGHGGMEYFDAALCGALAASEVPIRLYTCDETRFRTGLNFPFQLPYRGIYGRAPSWRRGLRYARGTLAALTDARRHGARVAHFHLFHVGVPEYLNVQLARSLGFRVVLTAHDVHSFVERLSVSWMMRAVYRAADHVIVQSGVAHRELLAHFPFLRGRVSLIPHGNYLGHTREAPPPDAARRELGLPADARVLLFFGQIKEVKGLDLLIDALPAIATKHPQALLVIAGKEWKDDFGKYRAQMERLGVAERCICHIRYIPDERLASYFAAADAVVLPYRRIYQSGVLLMALSYGKPVVASDIEGFTEVVSHGDTGYLFAAGDARALASTVVQALDDNSVLRAVGKRGLQMVAQQFDWGRIGKATADVYRTALARVE